MDDKSACIEKYVANRFSIGLEAYEKSLKRNGLDPISELIIDIGCGPGQWSFAASLVARDAQVMGFDTNQKHVNFARRYAHEHGFDKVVFEILSYDDLPKVLQGYKFDAVMCNGVLMYVDRDKAFNVFDCLLKARGILLLFHNHHIGYYLYKLLRGVNQRSLQKIYAYGFIPLGVNVLKRVLLRRDDGDVFLTVRYLKSIAEHYGIKLEEIPTEPLLTYRRSFLGFPYVFSLRGERI